MKDETNAHPPAHRAERIKDGRRPPAKGRLVLEALRPMGEARKTSSPSPPLPLPSVSGCRPAVSGIRREPRSNPQIRDDSGPRPAAKRTGWASQDPTQPPSPRSPVSSLRPPVSGRPWDPTGLRAKRQGKQKAGLQSPAAGFRTSLGSVQPPHQAPRETEGRPHGSSPTMPRPLASRPALRSGARQARRPGQPPQHRPPALVDQIPVPSPIRNGVQDVTPIVRVWVSGDKPNRGFVIAEDVANEAFGTARSQDPPTRQRARCCGSPTWSSYPRR